MQQQSAKQPDDLPRRSELTLSAIALNRCRDTRCAGRCASPLTSSTIIDNRMESTALRIEV
jgi:hypothetical protein